MYAHVCAPRCAGTPVYPSMYMHVCRAVHVCKAEATSGVILRNTTHLLTWSFTGPMHGLELTSSARLSGQQTLRSSCLPLQHWKWMLCHHAQHFHMALGTEVLVLRGTPFSRQLSPVCSLVAVIPAFMWQDKKENSWEWYWSLLPDRWDSLQGGWLRKETGRRWTWMAISFWSYSKAHADRDSQWSVKPQHRNPLRYQGDQTKLIPDRTETRRTTSVKTPLGKESLKTASSESYSRK